MRRLLTRLTCLFVGHDLKWHPPLLLGYKECMRCRDTFRVPL